MVTANLNSDRTDETRDDPTPDGACTVFGVACYVTVSPEGHFVNQISASK